MQGDTKADARRRLQELRTMGITMHQEPAELMAVYDRAHLAGNHLNYVEIGVAQGGTLWMGAMGVKPGGLVIGVDNYCEVGEPDRQQALKVVRRLEETHEVKFLTDKPSGELVEEVRELVGPRGIDHLHIDADHTYEGVKRDFELYSPLMRKDGLVQLHDINLYQQSWFGAAGVHRLWAELVQQYPGRFMELIHKRGPHGTFGIGLLRMP